jgi:hypothetical protein
MAFKTCAGALADGSKVIDFSPETDVEWGDDAERRVNPDYRVIEIAGPASWADFRSHGMPEQNRWDSSRCSEQHSSTCRNG